MEDSSLDISMLYETKPIMHIIAGFILWALTYFSNDKTPTKKDIIPALCLFGTYAGFYMDPLCVSTMVGGNHYRPSVQGIYCILLYNREPMTIRFI